MQQSFARATGPGAGVLKYDVITALSVMALHGSATVQTTVLRLVALITARYNWKQDQFCVAQPEMGRMWNVSERTVKREIKRMVQTDLLICVRPGVRGRVGAYRLNYQKIISQSAPVWSAVGPDYAARMQGLPQAPASTVVKVDFAARGGTVAPAVLAGDDLWSRVLGRLAQEDTANLTNWYMKLTLVSADGGVVQLKASSRFVASFVEMHLKTALTKAFRDEIQTVHRIEFLG